MEFEINYVQQLGKKNIVIFAGYRTYSWNQLIDDLVKRLELLGSKVTVIDVVDYTFPKQIQLPRRYKRIKFKKNFLKSIESGFEQEFTNLINIASENSLKSMLRDENPSNSRVNRHINSVIIRKSKKLLQVASSYLHECKPDLVLIHNGRFSYEVALTLSAKKNNVSHMYFEFFDGNQDSYYLSKFPIHDRVALQNDYLSVSSQLVDFSEANNWLLTRSNPNSKNLFALGWENYEIKSPVDVDNLFLTSSTDETGAFGEGWNIDSWSDQYEAFDFIISELETHFPEENSVIRVHPNLINKSKQTYKNEVVALKKLQHRHPKLKIVWHHETINTYSLINSAKRIFVSRSTAGLESSAQGKNVWVTAGSFYDDVCDLRKFFSKHDLVFENFSNWEVDKTKALKFIAFLLARNIPIPKVQKIGCVKRIQSIFLLILSQLNPSGILRLFIVGQLMLSVSVRRFVLNNFGVD